MSERSETNVAVDRRVMPCDEPCPKCGHNDVARRFIPKGGEVPYEGYDRCANKYGTGQCNWWSARRDHLNNVCRCCGYQWQTLPLKRSARHNARGNAPDTARTD